MTIQEFSRIAFLLKTYYPQDSLLPTQEAVDLWYEGLEDLDVKAVVVGLKKYVLTNHFPPTISDLREYACAVMGGEELNETHAWNLVYHALGNSLLHADEEFAKLPPAVQRAVHSPGQLREWAMMDIETVNSVIYSNFLRTFRAESAREKRESSIPEGLRMLEKMTAEALGRKQDGTLPATGTIPELPAGTGARETGQETGQKKSLAEEREACEKDALRDPEELASKLDKLRKKLYGG